MQSAGLKKFSMELGGKSPFVVFDDADLERALDAARVHDLLQQRRALHRRQRASWCSSRSTPTSPRKFAERAKRITVGDPLDEKTIVGPMISQAHLAKVRSYIELGPKEGATLLCGGLDAPALPARVQQGQLRACPPCSPTSTTA